MTTDRTPLTARRAWQALAAHYETVRELHLRQLFAADPKRGERLTAEAVGLYLDYSKHRITDDTLRLLLQLAEESGLRAHIDAMFRGRRSTSRKTAPSCTWPCVRRAAPPSSSTARTWCRRSTPCSTG